MSCLRTLNQKMLLHSLRPKENRFQVITSTKWLWISLTKKEHNSNLIERIRNFHFWYRYFISYRYNVLEKDPFFKCIDCGNNSWLEKGCHGDNQKKKIWKSARLAKLRTNAKKIYIEQLIACPMQTKGLAWSPPDSRNNPQILFRKASWPKEITTLPSFPSIYHFQVDYKLQITITTVKQ